MSYNRTAAQKSGDFHRARAYETLVAERMSVSLGLDVVCRFDAKDDLDVWVPGYMLDVKEKNQPLTPRWHTLEGVPEENLFVLDELGYRRALRHYPHVFFALKDNPQDRLFLAPLWELAGVERSRKNRVGKGKFIIDLTNFRQLEDEYQIPFVAHQLLVAMPWLKSECLTEKEIGQV